MFLSLFPTLVIKKLNFLNDQQCSLIENFYHQNISNKALDHPQFLGSSKSTHQRYDINVLKLLKNDLGLKSINKNIEMILNEYCYNSKIDELQISNSWFNLQNKKSVLKNHNHPNSVLSAVIYINADHNSSPLVFENPNPYTIFQKFNLTHEDCYNNNPRKFFIQPKRGMLILFPSWLNHGSDHIENNMDNRLTISFNTSWKRYKVLYDNHEKIQYI